MMRLLGLLLAVASLGYAQTRIEPAFVYTKSEDLSGADATITVQQPAASSKRVRFVEATVQCEVETVVTIRLNGTAASSTDDSSAIIDITGRSLTPAFKAYHTSNAGSGTTGPAYTCSGGWAILSIDLGKYVFDGGVATTNLTLDTDDVTGWVRVAITIIEE
jgi:hypothetical protein